MNASDTAENTSSLRLVLIYYLKEIYCDTELQMCWLSPFRVYDLEPVQTRD